MGSQNAHLPLEFRVALTLICSALAYPNVLGAVRIKRPLTITHLRLLERTLLAAQTAPLDISDGLKSEMAATTLRSLDGKHQYPTTGPLRDGQSITTKSNT